MTHFTLTSIPGLWAKSDVGDGTAASIRCFAMATRFFRGSLSGRATVFPEDAGSAEHRFSKQIRLRLHRPHNSRVPTRGDGFASAGANGTERSEEHTSELQSLMRISYAVFCLKKTN